MDIEISMYPEPRLLAVHVDAQFMLHTDFFVNAMKYFSEVATKISIKLNLNIFHINICKNS